MGENKKSIIALIIPILITNTSFVSTVPGQKVVGNGHEFTTIENSDAPCRLVGYKNGELLTLTYEKLFNDDLKKIEHD